VWVHIFGFRFYEEAKADVQCSQVCSSSDDNNDRTKKGQNEQQLGILPAQEDKRQEMKKIYGYQ
jgi:hypothetical protein